MYEKGVSKAGSLALWSIQPALHLLEPRRKWIHLCYLYSNNNNSLI